MNFIIERIGRDNYDEDEIIDNFSYEFFEDIITELDSKKDSKNLDFIKQEQIVVNNNVNNIKTKSKKEKSDLKNNITENKKDENYDMIIDFDEENIEKKDSIKNNYSLDQEDILEILNLNKDNINNNIISNEDNIEKNLFDKLNAKIILKDLKEKKGHNVSFIKFGIDCCLGSPLYKNLEKIGALSLGSYWLLL